MEALTQYTDFLWAQFQYDWGVFTTPWVLYTVLPAIFYFLFFIVKWWVLLVPITLPCTILSRNSDDEEVSGQLHDLKDKLK